jgi:TldD protein
MNKLFPDQANLRELIAEAIKAFQADYWEIHLEKTTATSIQYRGRELDSIRQTSSSGGNVRALVKGGWGFVSFNQMDNLKDKIALAIKQAQLVGKEISQFVPMPPVEDFFAETPATDASKLPLTAKKNLLEEYNGIILSTPKIETSNIVYHDSSKQTIFANSEGSYIEQRKGGLALRITAVARDGSDVQQAGLSLGSDGDFAEISALHHQVRETAELAVKFLSAPIVKSSEYTVILDPVLAGVFTHEAFGHLSESDFVYQNEPLKEIMRLERRFGNEQLNIVDDATIPHLRGSYKYDDEGVPGQKSYLIKEGRLVGRLHSRETAAKMKEPPTGNARALNYHFPPIVRMTNTYIEPQANSLSQMMSGIKEGIYVKNWYGGTTSMEMFTFSAGEAYFIRHGEIAELLRPLVLTGNVFATLMNIDAIGDDLKMNQGGGCGKGGQSPLPVSNGSPHIRIQHCLIGGK